MLGVRGERVVDALFEGRICIGCAIVSFGWPAWV